MHGPGRRQAAPGIYDHVAAAEWGAGGRDQPPSPSGGRPVDFGRDVFPALLAQGRPLYGYRMAENEGLWWIDRPEDLAWVEGHWHKIGPRLLEAGRVGHAARRRP